MRTALSGLVFSSLCLLVGCGSWFSDDKESEFNNSSVKFHELHVISAVPMKKQGGEYVPLCRSTTEEPVGLQLNILLQGTYKHGKPVEEDLSIQPFSTVNHQSIDSTNVTTKLFEIYFSCVEPYPDSSLTQCAEAFLGGNDMPIDHVDHFNYHQPEPTIHEKVAVAVLFDISGSMKGLATPYSPFNEDSFEAISAAFMGPLANATDPKNARYAALESFLKTLNDDDAVILFAFNEYGIEVVCELPGKPGANYDNKIEECFSTDRSLILARSVESVKSALDSLQGEERGRTPLWSAIEKVYSYMQGFTYEAKAAGVNDYKLRHILVIGDGPDTCAPSPEWNQCTGGCVAYSTPYETVREMVEADPMDERIPIHFVQMAAKGYPDRDPRQQEISCLTGGHYSFVNTMDIPSNLLQDVLTTTINRIRYTFRGYWRLQVPLGMVRKANDPPRGWLYGVAGGGQVLPGDDDLLVPQESTFDFKVNDDSVYDLNNADKRISFRKECDPEAPSVCPESEAHNKCSSREWWCEAQTLTCRSAEAWEPNGNPSTCDPQGVYVSLETRTKMGSSAEVINELFKLDGIETRCCRGDCMPPNPPEVPADVAKPDGMASACFWFDHDKGWVLTDPAQFDADDEGALAWVYFATLNITEKCQLEDFEPYLSGYESTDFAAEDWSHCDDVKNCFQPPDL